MADLVLSNGKEITFNFYKITRREWRGLFDKSEEEETSDAKIAQVCGLSPDEFEDLPYPDYHILMKEFWRRAADPLADPKNSVSVPSAP